MGGAGVGKAALHGRETLFRSRLVDLIDALRRVGRMGRPEPVVRLHRIGAAVNRLRHQPAYDEPPRVVVVGRRLEVVPVPLVQRRERGDVVGAALAVPNPPRPAALPLIRLPDGVLRLPP